MFLRKELCICNSLIKNIEKYEYYYLLNKNVCMIFKISSFNIVIQKKKNKRHGKKNFANMLLFY